LNFRYNLQQVVSVMVVTIGVVLTTLSAIDQTNISSLEDQSSYLTGIMILLVALILSGLLGLVQDWTYGKFKPSGGGNTWQESMFYLHLLSLPMFISSRRDIVTQLVAMGSAPRVSLRLPLSSTTSDTMSHHRGGMMLMISSAHLSLFLNTITQLLCVAGVHQLTTQVSALTVTLILAVRKAVSLVLTVTCRFGGEPTVDVDMKLMSLGAFMVLLGTVLYSIANVSKQSKVKIA
jgi:solute carrier family 35 (UDP-xylose/UDP-N-acetylglucosamine transporter), member B4